MGGKKWTPSGPICPRCGGNVMNDGVVISQGIYAGQTRHRTCFTPTQAEQDSTRGGGR